MGDSAEKSEAASLNREGSRVPSIITGYALQIRAIRECATHHIQIADAAHGTLVQKFVSTIREASVEDDGQPVEASLQIRGGTVRSIRVEAKHVEQVGEVLLQIGSPQSRILSQSLLIFGFSSFDAFLGSLLRRLYREEPQLIHKIEEKSITVGEVVKCTSLDEVVDRLIDRDISALLRNSYNDTFSTLANRHGVSTLKKFDKWPSFIEASQRRNLVTHCNGVVNSQYVESCRKAGYALPLDVAVGTSIDVTTEYLCSCLDILYEVGVKLGHTLWRITSPGKTDLSEKLLTDQLFDLLTREEWTLAKTIGEFAINLPKPVKDIQVKISRINYAQALKWSGDDEAARKILDAVDWSSSIRDLRLGVEVLRENYDEAANLMREIGKKGELVEEEGYREWPIFRQFRETLQFRDAFMEVYGLEFVPPLGQNDREPDEGTVGEEQSDDEKREEGISMPSEQPSKKHVSDTNKNTGDVCTSQS